MKANFGLLPPLDPPPGKKKWPKRERYGQYSLRALRALQKVLTAVMAHRDASL